MATGPLHPMIHSLRRIALREAADRTDEQLLESFLDQQDSRAFESLVRRHGPMVLTVCRRVLNNRHDAEDAFQATFLVLVRKAASLGRRHLLANWLYGVAYRTALKARAAVARRRAREQQFTDLPQPEPRAERIPGELLARLDDELNRLPDKYRMPVILCDLQGLSRTAAARQVGWPVGTLNWRLAHARTLLAKRLVRYGLSVSGGALAEVVSQQAVFASMSPSMVSSTIRAAAAVATGPGAIVGVVPAKISVLVQGVLQTMLLSKLKTAGAVVLLVAMAACGGGLLSYRTAAAQANKPQTANAASTPSSSTPLTATTDVAPQPIRLGRAESDYGAVFEKAVQVVGDYFEVAYANRYEGRIETLPSARKPRRSIQPDESVDRAPAVRRRAYVYITPADAGGFLVEVLVLKQVRTSRTWKPAGRDNELERTILRRLAAEGPPTGDRLGPPPAPTPVAPEDDATASEQAGNFRVNAPTLAIARTVCQAAERYRKDMALEWLGHELPRWSEPCPIHVTMTPGGPGSATSFAFDNGKVLDQNMRLEGPLDRIVNGALPREMAHVILAHHFGSPVPRWADEGAAILSYASGEQQRSWQVIAHMKTDPRQFIPLRRLFPLMAYPADVLALRAEGYSVTRFLVAARDRKTFLAFVAQGKRDGWDTAVKQHYGYPSVEALEIAWLLSFNDENKRAADIERLRGRWVSTSWQEGGRVAPPERATEFQLDFRDDMLEIQQGNQLAARAVVQFIADQLPRSMDLRIAGTTVPAIYRLEGDRLTICLGKSGGPRPRRFSTSQADQFKLISLEREKAASKVSEDQDQRLQWNVSRKLELAFGKDFDDIRPAAIKLDIPSRHLVLAANQFSILEDGRLKFSPCWYASFDKDQITTIRCEEAYFSLDGSISGLAELARRKILAIEPSGRVRITFRPAISAPDAPPSR